MATVESITSRVRLELGDIPVPFRTSIRGDGEKKDFELGGRNLLPAVSVFRVNSDGTLTDYSSDDSVTNAGDPYEYTVDLIEGEIRFLQPPSMDETIIAEGKSYGLFSDAELQTFVAEALVTHVNDRIHTSRYRDSHGFIRYDRVPLLIDSLRPAEEPLVAIWATILAFWALATDAATDINVQTSEGTVIPRGQRFQQITSLIELLETRYKELSLMMGVGIFAPEVFTMRRVSRLTGRLVPVFVDREYDETGPPVRIVPAVQERDADIDGPLSPWWPTGVGGN